MQLEKLQGRGCLLRLLNFFFSKCFGTFSKLVVVPCSKKTYLDFNFSFEVEPREENRSMNFGAMGRHYISELPPSLKNYSRS